MGKHIPGNPAFVNINMPGASSMTLANHLARAAPRDCTAFGAVDSALIFDPIFGGPRSKAQFRGTEMSIVGNAVVSSAVLVALKQSGVESIADIRKGGPKELVIAASTPSGNTFLLPMALKNVLGLRLKIISGYAGSREAAMALETGEVMGRVWDMEGVKATRPQWLADGTLKLLAQLAPKKHPTVPADVPLAGDLAQSEEDRKALDLIAISTTLARPYLAPPGLPPERLRALRDAFMATMRDPEFLSEMAKLQLTVDPVSGDEMEKAVREAYELPDSLIQRVRQALSNE